MKGFLSKLLKTQIKEKKALVKTELQISFQFNQESLVKSSFWSKSVQDLWRIHEQSLVLPLCGHHVRPQNIVRGSHRSWKTWKVMEFANFIFTGLESRGISIVGHGKSWKIKVFLIDQLLQMTKQGQCKIERSS